MPGFNGLGPRATGRPGRGLGRRFRLGQGHADEKMAADQGDMYAYTLEELNERKQALEEEIRWIEDRIKEIESDK